MKGGLSGAPHDKKETRVKYGLLILDTPGGPEAGAGLEGNVGNGGDVADAELGEHGLKGKQ